MKSYAVGLLAALLLCAVQGGAQSAVLAKMTCTGSYKTLRIGGAVLLDARISGGMTSTGAATHVAKALAEGRLPRGFRTLRLFGYMRDQHGRLINFEAYLKAGNRSVGSVWVNGRRQYETHMVLVLHKRGFVIYPRTGGRASYRCRRR